MRSSQRPPWDRLIVAARESILGLELREGVVLQMLKRLDLSSVRQCVLLLSLVGLPTLTGCGYLTRWYNGRQNRPNPHSVTISWTASPSAVQGYYVYRVSAPAAPVRLNVRVVEGTQYTDHTVEAGQTYNYYVTSVDPKGTESSPSVNLTVSVPWSVKTPAQQ